MTDHVIPDEAVEAAMGVSGRAVMAIMNERVIVRRILEAAYPHLLAEAKAEAWEVGALAADAKQYLLEQNPYR